MNNYESLKLDNQLCFQLYACTKEIIRKHKPLLDEIDLTYTQYITMMVLWEKKEISSKELGNYLYLDSGTLTPLLKKLELKGYISRERDSADVRNLKVKITKKGIKLRDKALSVPKGVRKYINLTTNEVKVLFKILHKMLDERETEDI